MLLLDAMGRRTISLFVVGIILASTACDVGGIPTTSAGDTNTRASASSKPSPPGSYRGNGTDPDLREIFLGRCADFKASKVNPTADPGELRLKNCSMLWELFLSAFSYREACDANETMYETFVEEATITVPVHKSTFWDGWDIYSTVRSYANEGKRSWTLEYSLVGYLINNLKFCGQEDPPGLRYDSCPDTDECGFAKGPDAFWARASTYFGKQAKGQVRVFLNSNRRGGAFQIEESYFAKYELVNLPPESVERVNIYLITDLEKNHGDNCTSTSIVSFKNMLDGMNISYTCYDQPRDVLHLLCVDGNGSSDCALTKDTALPTEAAPPSTTSKSPTITGQAHVLNLILTTLVALFLNSANGITLRHTS